MLCFVSHYDSALCLIMILLGMIEKRKTSHFFLLVLPETHLLVTTGGIIAFLRNLSI